MPLGNQLFSDLRVAWKPQALRVRPILAAKLWRAVPILSDILKLLVARTLIDLNTESRQLLNNKTDRSWNEPFTVCILYSQQELAAMLLGKEIGKKSGAKSTKMLKACGRWRKSCANFSHMLSF